MRPFIFIAALVILFSCKQEDKNDAGSAKNYTPIAVDTNCISPWSDAFFELKTKNFDTIFFAIRAKLISILGGEAFNDEQVVIMQDLLKKAMFPLDSVLIPGNLQIDTTNLLLLKDYFKYYASDKIRPRNYDWRQLLTQNKLFTFQKSTNFEIGYTFYPCIKKLIRQTGKFKRIRKGPALPEFSKDTDALIDELNVYDCLLNISIHINVNDKSGLISSKRQFYEVKLTDTVKVYATADLNKVR